MLATNHGFLVNFTDVGTKEAHLRSSKEESPMPHQVTTPNYDESGDPICCKKADDCPYEVSITQTPDNVDVPYIIWRLAVSNDCEARCGAYDIILKSDDFEAFETPALEGEIQQLGEHEFYVNEG